jgi:hypothetical protein
MRYGELLRLKQDSLCPILNFRCLKNKAFTHLNFAITFGNVNYFKNFQ